MSLAQPPSPGSSPRPCLTGLFPLNLPALRGGALSTAEAAPGARWLGGMKVNLETLSK